MIADYGGIAGTVPLFAAAFILVTLSSIGLPGLNGFVGEFLILLGAFGAAPRGGDLRHDWASCWGRSTCSG